MIDRQMVKSGKLIGRGLQTSGTEYYVLDGRVYVMHATGYPHVYPKQDGDYFAFMDDVRHGKLLRFESLIGS